MRKQTWARWLLLMLVICGGILMLMYPRALSQQTPIDSPLPVSLRHRTEPTGNYVGYAGPSTSPTFTDINQVTLLSTDIITGTALDNECTLSRDGSFITIDYQIRVDSKVKGPLSGGEIIKVSVPGGKVGFYQPDGSVAYAEIRTPWFKKMEKGKQYYLFLLGNGPLNQKYGIPSMETVGGPQGVFEIAGGVVKSNSGRLRDPIWQYHYMPFNDFNTLVKNLVATNNGMPVPTPTPSPALMP